MKGTMSGKKRRKKTKWTMEWMPKHGGDMGSSCPNPFYTSSLCKSKQAKKVLGTSTNSFAPFSQHHYRIRRWSPLLFVDLHCATPEFTSTPYSED